MTLNKEPLDDDMLGVVTGGAGLNQETSCPADSYLAKTGAVEDGTCNTCVLKELDACPFAQ